MYEWSLVSVIYEYIHWHNRGLIEENCKGVGVYLVFKGRFCFHVGEIFFIVKGEGPLTEFPCQNRVMSNISPIRIVMQTRQCKLWSFTKSTFVLVPVLPSEPLFRSRVKNNQDHRFVWQHLYWWYLQREDDAILEISINESFTVQQHFR